MRLTNEGNGFAMDDYANIREVGNPIGTYPWHGGANQLWYFNLETLTASECGYSIWMDLGLLVQWQAAEDPTTHQVALRRSDGVAPGNARWLIHNLPPPDANAPLDLYFINQETGLCLSAPASGAQLVGVPCDTTDESQLWNWDYVGGVGGPQQVQRGPDSEVTISAPRHVDKRHRFSVVVTASATGDEAVPGGRMRVRSSARLELCTAHRPPRCHKNGRVVFRVPWLRPGQHEAFRVMVAAPHRAGYDALVASVPRSTGERLGVNNTATAIVRTRR